MDTKTATTYWKGAIEMEEQKFLFASEVAALMGDKWTRQRVHIEYKRGTFPAPAKTIQLFGSESPQWTPEQIESEKKKRGLSNEK